MRQDALAPSSAQSLHAWPALLLAPLAFAVNLIITYALVPWACAHQKQPLVHVVDAVFLLIALFGVLHGWRLWLAYAGARGSDAGDHDSQRQFLGITGTLLSAISALAILAQWFTALVVPACQA